MTKPERKSLYQLTQEENELRMEFDWALGEDPDPETGEIPTDEGAMALVSIQMQSAEKIECMCRIIEEFEYTAALADAEYQAAKEIIDRKRQRAKSCESAVDRIKKMILRYLAETGKREMTAGARLLKVANTQKSVVIDPAAELQMMRWDDEYVRVKYEADKNAIKAAEKEGRPIPEGVTVVQGTRLIIK